MYSRIIGLAALCLLVAGCQPSVQPPSGYFVLEPNVAAPQSASVSISDAKAPPVLTHGAPGSWDSSDVLNPSVIRFNGKLYNYFSGYDGKTWHTGLATSTNGKQWTLYPGNPILSPHDGWSASYIAANGSAIVWKGKVLYFYQGRSAKGITEIGLATSRNGRTFKVTKSPVFTPGAKHSWDGSAVGDPYVIKHNGKLILFYLGMDELQVQRLGVAKSTDGVHWTRFVENPILNVGAKGSFDAHGLGEPSVIFDPPYFYMLYTGRARDETRDIGWAVSPDGVHWKKMSQQGLFDDTLRESWDSEVVCDTTLLRNNDGTVSVWFGGGDKREPAQGLNGAIGHFMLHLPLVPSSYDADATGTPAPQAILLGAWKPDGPPGRRSAWAGPDVAIYLKKPKGQHGLAMSGWMPYSLYKKAGIAGPVKIAIGINGKTVATRAIDAQVLFSIAVPPSVVHDAMGSSSIARITIDTNHSIVPSQIEKSRDTRRLSLKIIKIAFEQPGDRAQ